MPTHIETWNGDMDELVSLIGKTWRAAYSDDSYYDFDEDYLRFHFDGPHTDPSRLFAIYHERGEKKRLVAFLAFMNRIYQFGGKVIPGVFTSFLSVDPDVGGRLIGVSIVGETLLRMKADYEATGEPAIICFYVDRSQKTDKLFKKVSRDCSVALHRIREVRLGFRPSEKPPLTRLKPLSIAKKLLLNAARWARAPGRSQSGRVVPFGQEHLQECVALANERAAAQKFSRFWDAEHLAHQLSYKNVSRTYVLCRSDGQNRVSGFLNLRVSAVNGAGSRHKIATIDWVSDSHLTRRERNHLYSFVFQEAKRAGCAGVMLPFVPAFATARSPSFRPTSRGMDMYCYNFDPQHIPLEGIEDAYEVVT